MTIAQMIIMTVFCTVGIVGGLLEKNYSSAMWALTCWIWAMGSLIKDL